MEADLVTECFRVDNGFMTVSSNVSSKGVGEDDIALGACSGDFTEGLLPPFMPGDEGTDTGDDSPKCSTGELGRRSLFSITTPRKVFMTLTVFWPEPRRPCRFIVKHHDKTHGLPM